MKNPAMLFYTGDFLAETALMSMKERGQYITLLCLQQQRGHMSLADIKKAIGAITEEVRSKFETDADGLLYNERVDEEIQKREAHSQRQRENVSKRWNKNGINDGNTIGNTTVYTAVLPLGDGLGSIGDSNKENRGSGGKEKKRKGADPFDEFAAAHDGLRVALSEFEEMRNKTKKPMTARAKTLLIAELKKLSSDPQEQIKIIEQSVLHNWQSVYALKEEKTDGADRRGLSTDELAKRYRLSTVIG